MGSPHSEEYVLAPDSVAAGATYYAIPDVAAARAKDREGTEVHEVKRLGPCVFAFPVDITDITGDGGES